MFDWFGWLFTPWKINGWKLQPSPMKRKEHGPEPNLHEDMFQPLISRGVWFIFRRFNFRVVQVQVQVNKAASDSSDGFFGQEVWGVVGKAMYHPQSTPHKTNMSIHSHLKSMVRRWDVLLGWFLFRGALLVSGRVARIVWQNIED